MESSIDQEIWRQIPPEEKFELMSRAHAKGIMSAGITIIIASTIAVGLKLSWFMWGSFIAAPFIFQFAAGKEWRGLRPRLMLHYLAARSATRRYAFNVRCQDLTPKFMFKGHLEEMFDQDHLQEALEAMVDNTREAEVWVSLFSDAVVMIAERAGGAEMKLGHLLDDKLIVQSSSGGGANDYKNGREIFLTVKEKNRDDSPSKQYRLTSKYPAALVVFEKKLKMLQAGRGDLAHTDIEDIAAAISTNVSSEDDEKFDSLFSF